MMSPRAASTCSAMSVALVTMSVTKSRRCTVERIDLDLKLDETAVTNGKAKKANFKGVYAFMLKEWIGYKA